MKTDRKILIKQNIVNTITIAVFVILFSLQMIMSTFLRANIVVDGILDAIMQGALLIAEMLVFIKYFLKFQKLNEANIPNKINKLLQLTLPLIIVLLMTLVNSVRDGKREEDSILILCVMVALCIDYDYKAILKTAYRCGVIIVTGVFILSMLGLIENNRGNSFGFIYRTDYAAHLLFLFLIFCFYYGGNLSWQGELGILFMTIINMLFVGGKTSYICMSIVVFVTYLRHYRRIGKVPYQEESKIIKIVFRIIYIPVIIVDKISRKISDINLKKLKATVRIFNKYSFIIFAALMIGLTMLYVYVPVKIFDYIPKSNTVRARLRLGILGFEQFSIKLFGNSIPQRGAGGTEGYIPFYYFLDSSYIRMILQFGLIVFIVLVGLMTLVQFKLYKEKMFYELFLVAIVALDCAMEHHIIDFSYNTFALLAWASLIHDDTENVKPIFFATPSGINTRENVSVLRQQMSSKPFKFIYRGFIVLMCVMFGCSLYASYRISTFRGREPVSTATVILTGNNVDGIKSHKLLDEKISSVRRFMGFKEDSVCILCGSDDEINYMHRRLLEAKISDDRLYEVKSDSIETAIKECDSFIMQNNLPKRKAFCSFKMQQERISEIAHENGIPINMLEAKMPAEMYLQNYFMEQIKLMKVVVKNSAKNN